MSGLLQPEDVALQLFETKCMTLGELITSLKHVHKRKSRKEVGSVVQQAMKLNLIAGTDRGWQPTFTKDILTARRDSYKRTHVKTSQNPTINAAADTGQRRCLKTVT